MKGPFLSERAISLPLLCVAELSVLWRAYGAGAS